MRRRVANVSRLMQARALDLGRHASTDDVKPVDFCSVVDRRRVRIDRVRLRNRRQPPSDVPGPRSRVRRRRCGQPRIHLGGRRPRCRADVQGARLARRAAVGCDVHRSSPRMGGLLRRTAQAARTACLPQAAARVARLARPGRLPRLGLQSVGGPPAGSVPHAPRRAIRHRRRTGRRSAVTSHATDPRAPAARARARPDSRRSPAADDVRFRGLHPGNAVRGRGGSARHLRRGRRRGDLDTRRRDSESGARCLAIPPRRPSLPHPVRRRCEAGDPGTARDHPRVELAA